MNKKMAIQAIPLVLTAMLFAGCSSAPTQETMGEAEISDESSQIDEASTGDAMTMGAMEGAEWTGHPLDDPASPLSSRVIYFDLDRSDVKLEFHEVILAHAEYLANNVNVAITLEGHGDERGTREYNLGLGERRAKAVRQLLIAGGASDSQIHLISYGEEQPAAMGHDETAWAQNRRVVLVY